MSIFLRFEIIYIYGIWLFSRQFLNFWLSFNQSDSPAIHFRCICEAHRTALQTTGLRCRRGSLLLNKFCLKKKHFCNFWLVHDKSLLKFKFRSWDIHIFPSYFFWEEELCHWQGLISWFSSNAAWSEILNFLFENRATEVSF